MATLLLVALAVGIGVASACGSSIAADLQWARGINEPWWRVMTCQLSHWSWPHLAWDTATVLLVGCWCEWRYPWRTRGCLLASLALIPLGVAWMDPTLTTFRGLSGIATALVVQLGIAAARDDWHRDRPLAWFALAVMAGTVAKSCWEFATGGTVFVHDTAMVPVPLAHIVGAVIGAACALCPSHKNRRTVRTHGPLCEAPQAARPEPPAPRFLGGRPEAVVGGP